MKRLITSEKLPLTSADKSVRAAIREGMKTSGYFNRPNHRVEPSGKQYNRKPKHKNRQDW